MGRVTKMVCLSAASPVSGRPAAWSPWLLRVVAVAALASLAAACGPSDQVDVDVTDGGSGRSGSDGVALDRSGDGSRDTADRPAMDTPPVDAPVTPDSPPDTPPPPPDTTPLPEPPVDMAMPVDMPVDLPPDAPVTPMAMYTVTHEPGQPLTNLTSVGTLYWEHYGLGGVANWNRKVGGTERLSTSMIGSGTEYAYSDRPIRFSWTDGMPVAMANMTPEGISVGEAVGRGYQIEVEGDVNKPRVLRVYCGVWGATAEMSVRFNSGTMPSPYTDSTLVATAPGKDRIYTITFRPATASQKLIVRWTVDATSDIYGNVSLQAAALSD